MFQREDIMEQKITDTRQRAVLLGPDLWLLFWLFIPNGIVNIANKYASADVLKNLDLAVSLLCTAVLILLLWKMSPANDMFRKAALFELAGLAVSLLLAVLKLSPEETLHMGSTILVSLLDLAAVYFMYHGCTQVFSDINDTHAKKWLKLWKLFLFVQILSIVLLARITVLNIGILPVLLSLVLTVASLVFAVKQLTLLHEAARLCYETARDEDGTPGYQQPKKLLYSLIALALIVLSAVSVLNIRQYRTDSTQKEHLKENPLPYMWGSVMQITEEPDGDGFFVLDVRQDEYQYLKKVKISTDTASDRPCPALEVTDKVYIRLAEPGNIEEPILAEYITVHAPSGEEMICKPGSTELEPLSESGVQMRALHNTSE